MTSPTTTPLGTHRLPPAFDQPPEGNDVGPGLTSPLTLLAGPRVRIRFPPAASQRRTRFKFKVKHRALSVSGTSGSNPASSSGESTANLTPSIRAPPSATGPRMAHDPSAGGDKRSPADARRPAWGQAALSSTADAKVATRSDIRQSSDSGHRSRERTDKLSPTYPIATLHNALEPLWRKGFPVSGNLYTENNFVALREICQRLYPQAGSKEMLDFTLSQALRNLGLSTGGPPPNTISEAVAKRLDAAFRESSSHRTHLCPLDLGDEIPEVLFGPNRIRSFTAEELADVVDPDRLARNLTHWRSNIGRLSRFAWLVVTESVALPGDPGARALPLLYVNLDHDFGHIEPHKAKFPDAVEAALFALLMVAWEDVASYADYDWRPFRVPWVHTIDDDIFARRMAIPDADTLTSEPEFYENEAGETIEVERPTRLPLTDDAAKAIRILDDPFWATLTAARRSSLCARPFPHFLVRAFASEGIDEFLAHITVVEAALGSALDHDQRSRPKIGTGNPGATTRVSWRIAGLLNEANAGERYRQLFKER